MPRFYIPHAGEPKRSERRSQAIVSEIWEARVSDGAPWRDAHSAFASFDPSRYGYEALDDLWKARHDSTRGFLRAQDIAFSPVSSQEMFEPTMYRGASAELTLFLLALWSAHGAPRDASFDHIFASLNLSDPRESIYFIVQKVLGFLDFAAERSGERCVMFIGADHHEEVLEANARGAFTLLRFDSGETLEAAMASTRPVVISVSRARLEALYSEFEILWDASLAGTCRNCTETGTVGLRCLSTSCREHGFYFLDTTLSGGSPGMRTGKILRRQSRRAYLLGDVFAQGSAASIYRAYKFDPQGRVNTDTVYAVKVLRGRHPNETSSMYAALEQGFVREHAMLTKLANRGHAAHVVELSGPANTTRQTRTDPLYLGLRYLPNAQTLANWLRARATPMRPEQVWRTITPIFGVLTRVHEFGAHGDISSSNLMILGESSTDLVLIDFGHASLDEESWTVDSHPPVPPSGPHAAPEAPGTDTARQDIYGLALVLTELLTGRVLVDAPSSYEPTPRSAFDVLEECLEIGRLSPAKLPRPLRRVLRKALMWDPARRYESMEAFRDAFTDALVRPQKSLGLAMRVMRAAIVLSLMAALTASGWWYAWNRPPTIKTRVVKVSVPAPLPPTPEPDPEPEPVVPPAVVAIDLGPAGDSVTHATVTLDDVRTSGHLTHIRGPLEPGTYTLKLEHEEFGSAQREITLVSGTQRVSFSLTELEGYRDPLAGVDLIAEPPATLDLFDASTPTPTPAPVAPLRRGEDAGAVPPIALEESVRDRAARGFSAPAASPASPGVRIEYDAHAQRAPDALYVRRLRGQVGLLRRGLGACAARNSGAHGTVTVELHILPLGGLGRVVTRSNQGALDAILPCVERKFRSLVYAPPEDSVVIRVQVDFVG